MRRSLPCLMVLTPLVTLFGCSRPAAPPTATRSSPREVELAPPKISPVGEEDWCRAVLGAGLVGQSGMQTLPTLASAGALEPAIRRASHVPTNGEARALLGAGLVGLGAGEQPLAVLSHLATLETKYRVVRTRPIHRTRHYVHHHYYHHTPTYFWHHTTTTTAQATRPAPAPSTRPNSPPKTSAAPKASTSKPTATKSRPSRPRR